MHAIDSLSVIWKADLTNKIKCSFFQAAVVSILLYECSTWTLSKRTEKKIDNNYRRILSEQVREATPHKAATTNQQEGGARGVVVIAVGKEHGYTSLNPGRD